MDAEMNGQIPIPEMDDNEFTEEKKDKTANMTTLQKVFYHLKANILIVLLVISMIVGITLGAVLRLSDPPLTDRQKMYLRFPGEILMNLLQLLILPLIMSSLISGMTSLDPKSSGKIGGTAVVYYLTTTLLAVIQGIVLVLLIQPGSNSSAEGKKTDGRKVEAVDTFLDLIRQMFPSNIIEACFSKKLTELVPKEKNVTDANNNITTIIEYEPQLKSSNGINMLGIVVFSIALGIAINRLGMRGKPIKCVIESFCDATMLIVSAVIWYSPVGVLFLVAAQVVGMESLEKMFAQLGLYFVTVMAGLALHGFVMLPLIYFIVVRKNPIVFVRGIIQAMMTALGTSSSSATLPITMKNLRENNGIDQRVISFVAPVGATINMDGTALYEAVAVIFIGQVRGLDMGISNVITICLTSTAAAIGAAGVPQAGLVTMVLVLTAVGFPTEDVGIILAVDWLLDRFRTMVNVMGDAFGCGIVQKIALGETAQSKSKNNFLQTVTESDVKANKPVNNVEGGNDDKKEGDDEAQTTEQPAQDFTNSNLNSGPSKRVVTNTNNVNNNTVSNTQL